MANSNRFFKLGHFYSDNNSYTLYRYIGNYGSKKVFQAFNYECTDRTGTWFYRPSQNLLVMHGFTLNVEIEIDSNEFFDLRKDGIKRCLLYEQGEVIK